MSDKQRCNHCMAVFDEALTACPECGKSDALMRPFDDIGVKESPVPGKAKKAGGWKTVPEEDVRLIYRCKDCQTEYHIAPGEASIPYCTEDGCANADNDADFEGVEVRT